MDFNKRCNRWIGLTLLTALGTGALILWLFVPEETQSVQTLWAVTAAMFAVIGIMWWGTLEGCKRMDQWMREDPVRSAPSELSRQLDRTIASLERFNEALSRHTAEIRRQNNGK